MRNEIGPDHGSACRALAGRLLLQWGASAPLQLPPV
jgi:hypothetical protein